MTRHIIRLREKFGWQTMLPQRCLEYKSSKIAIQKIILKVLVCFIQFYLINLNLYLNLNFIHFTDIKIRHDYINIKL